MVNFSQPPGQNGSNSYDITLNISSTGAKSLYLAGKSMKGNSNSFLGKGPVIVSYGGSYYNITGHRDSYSDDT